MLPKDKKLGSNVEMGSIRSNGDNRNLDLEIQLDFEKDDNLNSPQTNALLNIEHGKLDRFL